MRLSILLRPGENLPGRGADDVTRFIHPDQGLNCPPSATCWTPASSTIIVGPMRTSPKIAIVVGTRPEIIKMAPVVRACQARGAPFLLLHTGQHYSFEMDGVFFRELGLPPANHNLSIGSGSHPAQLAAILAGFEPILLAERPDVLLVEGDTNSVLGAALCAHKLGIRVGHVEAGLRSYDRGMPEEINRILTDHLSDHLFAPTERSREILLGEGVKTDRIHVTGNTVVDELMLQRDRARGQRRSSALRREGRTLRARHRASRGKRGR